MHCALNSNSRARRRSIQKYRAALICHRSSVSPIHLRPLRSGPRCNILAITRLRRGRIWRGKDYTSCDGHHDIENLRGRSVCATASHFNVRRRWAPRDCRLYHSCQSHCDHTDAICNVEYFKRLVGHNGSDGGARHSIVYRSPHQILQRPIQPLLRPLSSPAPLLHTDPQP